MANITNQLRNWERLNEYRRWQDATEANLLFGVGHLQRVPPLPSEYKAYGEVWLEEVKARIAKVKDNQNQPIKV